MLGRTLVVYVVVKSSQERRVALESRSSHGRHSLLWVESGSEGLVVCYKGELPPIEVHVEPFYPHTIDNASLSICAYLRYVLVNDQDAKVIGLSLPSGMMYQRTAPMPIGEAFMPA